MSVWASATLPSSTSSSESARLTPARWTTVSTSASASRSGPGSAKASRPSRTGSTAWTARSRQAVCQPRNPEPPVRATRGGSLIRSAPSIPRVRRAPTIGPRASPGLLLPEPHHLQSPGGSGDRARTTRPSRPAVAPRRAAGRVGTCFGSRRPSRRTSPATVIPRWVASPPGGGVRGEGDEGDRVADVLDEHLGRRAVAPPATEAAGEEITLTKVRVMSRPAPCTDVGRKTTTSGAPSRACSPMALDAE